MTAAAMPREFSLYAARDTISEQIADVERAALAGPFDAVESRRLDLLNGLFEAVERDIEAAEHELGRALGAVA
jgi:hypothetical protein